MQHREIRELLSIDDRECGGHLVERKGKYGTFHGCSNYPNCKFTTQ